MTVEEYLIQYYRSNADKNRHQRKADNFGRMKVPQNIGEAFKIRDDGD